MLFTAFEFSGFLFAYMSTQHPATSKNNTQKAGYYMAHVKTFIKNKIETS